MEVSVRRTLLRLGVAYALSWATTSMVAGPGSAALVSLTGNLSHSGLFIALFYVGSALGAALGGRAMDRYGRKPPLLVAYTVSAFAFAAAGFGVARSSLALFVAGTLVLAAAFGAANLTRVAAAEMFPPAERGRGVAWVQISAIFGAVVGPVLLLASEPLGKLLGRSPLSLVWFLAPPLLIAAVVVVSGALEPRSIAFRAVSGAGAADKRDGDVAGDRTRLIAVGMVALAASQAAMASVMGVSGAAVAHAGHGVNVLGALMFMHFVGMFALSRAVGRVADRFGRRPTIMTGLALLALGGFTVAFVPGTAGFAAGLLLVGLGWSFGFIGATVLLTDVTAPTRRARIMGRADLIAQLSAAVIATGGGWWFAAQGLAGLGIAAVAVAAAPLVLLGFVAEGQPGRYAQPAASRGDAG
jgi:MFS family permease